MPIWSGRTVTAAMKRAGIADVNGIANRRAAEYLREEHEAPQLLVGHSLGGAAVLTAAAKISEVRAVATIGAPSAPQHVEHLFSDRREEIEAQGSAEVDLAGRKFRIEKQFLDDLAGQDLESLVGQLKPASIALQSDAQPSPAAVLPS